MPDDNSTSRNVLVAFVGSRPLVIRLNDWEPSAVEDVTLDGEVITLNDEPVWALV
jgi:hypothetical protein